MSWSLLAKVISIIREGFDEKKIILSFKRPRKETKSWSLGRGSCKNETLLFIGPISFIFMQFLAKKWPNPGSANGDREIRVKMTVFSFF